MTSTTGLLITEKVFLAWLAIIDATRLEAQLCVTEIPTHTGSDTRLESKVNRCAEQHQHACAIQDTAHANAEGCSTSVHV